MPISTIVETITFSSSSQESVEGDKEEHGASVMTAINVNVIIFERVFKRKEVKENVLTGITMHFLSWNTISSHMFKSILRLFKG